MNTSSSVDDILSFIKVHNISLKCITNYVNNNDVSLEKNEVMSVLLPRAIDNKVSKEIIYYFLNICGKNNFLEYSIRNMNEKQVRHITKYFVYDNNFILKLLNKSKNGEIISHEEFTRLINKEIHIPTSLYHKVISSNNFKILDLLLVFENKNTVHYLNQEFNILIKAVENNSLTTLKILYSKGIDLNEKQYHRTAIALASFHGLESILRFLIDKVDNLNDKDNFYRTTPLFIALRKKNFKIVPILLENNSITIDEKDNNGNTALVLAVKYNNLELVKSLIQYGATINVKSNNGKPLLSIATANNSIGIVKYLIKSGIDLNMLDGNGDSALSIAIRCQLVEISKVLIDHGADINIRDSSGNTILLTALLTNNEELYTYLLNKCNDINIKNYDDKTAINIFTEKEDLEKIKLLIYYGADINSVDVYGNTPLLVAINRKCDNIVNYLIDNGADINVRNQNGDTPLLIASKKNYMECCKKLINNEVNVNYKDSNGNTSLMIAIKNERIELVKMLIEDSCVNEENAIGETPLYLAVENNSMELTKLLVRYGANINYKYKNDGNTILMKAFDQFNRKREIIKYLLDKGGNINEKNNEGCSVLSEVCKNRHSCLLYDKDKIDFLIEHGVEVTKNLFCYNREVEYYLKKARP